MKRITMVMMTAIGAWALIAYAGTEPEQPEPEPVEEVKEEPREVRIEVIYPEAEKLEEYLISKGAHELAEYANDIVQLDRWQEALAITGKETQFCQTGVGASRNNCGGIRSFKPGRGFKVYENVYDSVWDVSYLLMKPRYRDLTIEEMNGIYCVNEAEGGGKCPNWTETILELQNEIEEAVR